MRPPRRDDPADMREEVTIGSMLAPDFRFFCEAGFRSGASGTCCKDYLFADFTSSANECGFDVFWSEKRGWIFLSEFSFSGFELNGCAAKVYVDAFLWWYTPEVP